MVESIVLTNKVLNLQLPINMASRQYVLEEIDWGAIQSTNKSYKFINQIGVYVTGTTLESRDISILAWIVADSDADMVKRKQFLNSFINPLQELELQYQDYKIIGIPSSTVRYGVAYKDNNNVICKFIINLFCPDPMFYYRNAPQATIAEWMGRFHFPLSISKKQGMIFGIRTKSLIARVVNSGTMPCGFTVNFIAQGTVVNPKLININTQERIQFDYTMSAGETLSVTTQENEKTVYKEAGGIFVNAFNLLDLMETTFFSLGLGNNFLRYDADEGLNNLSITIAYNPRFLEVQQ